MWAEGIGPLQPGVGVPRGEGGCPGAIRGYLARAESVSPAHTSKFTLGAAFLFFHLEKNSYKSLGSSASCPLPHPASSTLPGRSLPFCLVLFH